MAMETGMPRLIPASLGPSINQSVCIFRVTLVTKLVARHSGRASVFGW